MNTETSSPSARPVTVAVPPGATRPSTRTTPAGSLRGGVHGERAAGRRRRRRRRTARSRGRRPGSCPPRRRSRPGCGRAVPRPRAGRLRAGRRKQRRDGRRGALRRRGSSGRGASRPIVHSASSRSRAQAVARWGHFRLRDSPICSRRGRQEHRITPTLGTRDDVGGRRAHVLEGACAAGHRRHHSAADPAGAAVARHRAAADPRVLGAVARPPRRLRPADRAPPVRPVPHRRISAAPGALRGPTCGPREPRSRSR